MTTKHSKKAFYCSALAETLPEASFMLSAFAETLREGWFELSALAETLLEPSLGLSAVAETLREPSRRFSAKITDGNGVQIEGFALSEALDSLIRQLTDFGF